MTTQTKNGLLKGNVISYQFSDNSGLLLYDIKTDASMLLDPKISYVEFCCDSTRKLFTSDKKTLEVISQHGFFYDI